MFSVLTLLPFAPCFQVWNPLSDFVSALAFSSFGLGTCFLPPLGWT